MIVIGRRWIGSSLFPTKRLPLLEELFEPIVMKTQSKDQDTISSLKNYVPPSLMNQIEASLSTEFNRHIIKTDFTLYEDPILNHQYEQAARLLQYTLASLDRAIGNGGQSAEGEGTLEWLRRECNFLLEEIKSGDRKRWVDAKKLIGKNWDKFTVNQRDALLPSIIILAKNPSLHPMIKQRILNHIQLVVLKTIQ